MRCGNEVYEVMIETLQKGIDEKCELDKIIELNGANYFVMKDSTVMRYEIT